MGTINEADLSPQRIFTTTVAFPSSQVVGGLADSTTFVTGQQGKQGVPGPPGKDAQWLKMTKADFDALPTKDPNTLYVIIG